MAIAQQTRTCATRLVYHWTFVAPATILSDEILETEGEAPQSLRAEASADGLCFLRIVHYLAHADLFHGQVAASPELLKTQPLDAFFTQEQLCGILPLDCRLQQRDGSLLDPATILSRISAHTHDQQPVTCTASDPETPLLPEPEAPLTLVVEVAVTAEEVAAVLPNPEAGASQVQRALLFLALRKLGHTQVRRRVRDEERWERVLTSTGMLLQRLRRWQRRTGQRLVNIVAEGSLSWHLLIGAPDASAFACAA